jgi:hypothetical protein
MIKEYQIEDTIVAYFDGRLNDEDSAELLHRVSVSPEIREIFQEHEAIRVVAYRAARNVAVSPELEESVFARVAALQEKSEKILPLAFWTLPRISAIAGAATLIAVGLFAPWGTSDTNSSNNSLVQGTEMTQVTQGTAMLDGSHVVENAILNGRKFSNKIGSGNTLSSNNMNSIADANPVGVIPLQKQADASIEIIPQAAKADRINMPGIGTPQPTLRSLSSLPDADNAPMFEVGLATNLMSGFNEPADVPQTQLLSEFAFRAAYNFDSRNQIGFRLTRVAFPELQTQPANLNGYTLVTGTIGQSQPGFSEEIYYKYRLPINDGLFYLTGSVGGGFYNLGSLLSGELGFEVPVSEKLIGGVSFILSRLHQNGSQEDVLNANALNGPVIYDGANVYNSLAGRFEYGMSYRF